jgi:tRNA (guanine-N(7)-)-methyltransferase
MRKVTSFGRRVGRKLKPIHHELVDQLSDRHAIKLDNCENIASFAKLLENCANQNISLEIGFGSGFQLTERAKINTNNLYIGCEPYMNGVVCMLRRMEQLGLNNIMFYPDDVKNLLAHVPDNAIESIYILYPDPWPKKKHAKRRIIQQEFLNLLFSKIRPGGELILATDHDDYYQWICAEFTKAGCFKNNNNVSHHEFPTDWIKTKYQLKAESQGKSSYYLAYQKN